MGSALYCIGGQPASVGYLTAPLMPLPIPPCGNVVLSPAPPFGHTTLDAPLYSGGQLFLFGFTSRYFQTSYRPFLSYNRTSALWSYSHVITRCGRYAPPASIRYCEMMTSYTPPLPLMNTLCGGTIKFVQSDSLFGASG